MFFNAIEQARQCFQNLLQKLQGHDRKYHNLRPAMVRSLYRNGDHPSPNTSFLQQSWSFPAMGQPSRIVFYTLSPRPWSLDEPAPLNQVEQRLTPIERCPSPSRYTLVCSHRSRGPRANNAATLKLCCCNEDTVLILCSLRLLVVLTRPRITVKNVQVASGGLKIWFSFIFRYHRNPHYYVADETIFLLFPPVSCSAHLLCCGVYDDISWPLKNNQCRGQNYSGACARLHSCQSHGILQRYCRVKLESQINCYRNTGKSSTPLATSVLRAITVKYRYGHIYPAIEIYSLT
jgi:hypothetical protein